MNEPIYCDNCGHLVTEADEEAGNSSHVRMPDYYDYDGHKDCDQAAKLREKD